MEKIIFSSKEGLNLSALFWDNQAFTSVILLHAMSAKKESWVDMADALSGQGYNVLAFDFRGHGESEGGNWQDFSNDEHAKYLDDLDAAVEYLKDAFPHTEIYLVGASIGANTAIRYMSEHHDIPKAVVLSAGLNYYGVDAEDAVQDLDVSQAVLFVGASDDRPMNEDDCGHQAQVLFELAASQKEKIIYPTGGHGTKLFETHPELIKKIEEFL